MWNNNNYVLIASGVLIAWNVITFAMYGIDKWKSIHNKWRIKETTLLLSAFLMGSFGATIGMCAFRHKTKHWKFKILVPLALITNVALLIGYFYIVTR